MAVPGQHTYSGRPLKWRVLGVLTGPTADALVDGDEKGLGAIEEIFSLPGAEAEVHVIKYPRLEDLSTQLQGWKPNFVYVYGGVNGEKKDVEKQSVSHLSFLVDSQGRFVEPALRLFLASFGGLHLDTVYFDSMGCSQIGEALHAAGVPNVVVWPQEAAPLCLPAMHFARSFFCMLRNRSMTVPEAFAMATHMSKTHFCQQTIASGTQALDSSFPRLLSRNQAVLPGIATVPPLMLDGIDVSLTIVECVPGYDRVRLLAPNAELRMLACGLSSFINSESLAYMGETLRALLTMEVRRLSVKRMTPCEKTPEHLPPSCSAVRCEIVSFSGVPLTVVLGGPVDVLQNQAVVEHALRQTLVADAHSLQFKLPPPNVPLPASRTNPVVANGAPVVEALVVTSVWCIQLLKVLCQDSNYRGLVAAGIGAISNSPVASFSKADANRFTTVVTNNDPTKLLQAPAPGENGTTAGFGDFNLAAADGMQAQPPGSSPGIAPVSAAGGTASSVALNSAPRPLSAAGNAGATPPLLGTLQRAGSAGGQLSHPGAPAQAGSSAHGGQFNPRMRSESPEHNSSAGQNPIRIRQHMQVAPWRSGRPPIKQCNEEQFMSDLIAFLTDRQGRQIDPKNFPEAILNGSRLDLFNLYREVCNRGGYQVGNGINWKGQVFPRMRNYTAQHKMTGVGNALKRHYQMFLMEYEHAHPEDVNGGQCALCGQGEECGTDWISCDMCDCWVHFSCDKRPFLGSFKEYSRGKTRTYCCPRCYEIKRQRSMQQQQQQEEEEEETNAANGSTHPVAFPEPLQGPAAQGIKAETTEPTGAASEGQLDAFHAATGAGPAVLAALSQPTPMVTAPSSALHPPPQQFPALAASHPVAAPSVGQLQPALAQPAPQQLLHAHPGGEPGSLVAVQPAPATLPASSQPPLPPSTGFPLQSVLQPQGVPLTHYQPNSQPAVSVPQVQVAAPHFHITLAPPKPSDQDAPNASPAQQAEPMQE